MSVHQSPLYHTYRRDSNLRVPVLDPSQAQPMCYTENPVYSGPLYYDSLPTHMTFLFRIVRYLLAIRLW